MNKIIISLSILVIISVLGFVYAGDLIDIGKKVVTYTETLIDDNTFVVEDGDNYVVWEKQEDLNSNLIQTDISNNNIELNLLEDKLIECNDIKNEEYKYKCEVETLNQIDLITGENIILEEKLEKTK